MASVFYPATLEDDNGAILVSFRDIPEAITFGNNWANVLEMAQDALVTALEFYEEGQRSLPSPSPAAHGDVMVGVDSRP